MGIYHSDEWRGHVLIYEKILQVTVYIGLYPCKVSGTNSILLNYCLHWLHIIAHCLFPVRFSVINLSLFLNILHGYIPWPTNSFAPMRNFQECAKHSQSPVALGDRKLKNRAQIFNWYLICFRLKVSTQIFVKIIDLKGVELFSFKFVNFIDSFCSCMTSWQIKMDIRLHKCAIRHCKCYFPFHFLVRNLLLFYFSVTNKGQFVGSLESLL